MVFQYTDNTSDCQSSGAPLGQPPPVSPVFQANQQENHTDHQKNLRKPNDQPRKDFPLSTWNLLVFEDTIRPMVSLEAFSSYKRCGSDWVWKNLLLPESGFELTPICSCDKWWCGYCAPKRAAVQARDAFNFFDCFTVEKIVGRKPVFVRNVCKLEFTLPKVVSYLLDKHPQEINRILPRIDRLLKKVGIKGAFKIIHYSSSRNPVEPHWHVHIVAWGRRWFEKQEIEDLRAAWKREVRGVLSYLEKTYGDFNLWTTVFNGIGFKEELEKLDAGGDVDLHVGFFKTKTQMRDYFLYQGRPFIRDLVKKAKKHNLGREYLEEGLTRLVAINDGPYRLRRARWTGLLSSKNRADFMESIGIAEKKREKRKSEKVFRFSILKIDHEREVVLCQKQGNYRSGSFADIGIPESLDNLDIPYSTFDERGKVRKVKLSPARFELPLRYFSFGPVLVEKRFERLARGPPGVGEA